MYRSHNHIYKSDSTIATQVILPFICLIIVLLYAVISPINKSIDERYVTCTVTDKTVKNDNKTSKYLIYTIDADKEVNVYEITDSWLKGRFNSSDLYGKITIGKTYRMTICGHRSPFLSMYPNIYEADEIIK